MTDQFEVKVVPWHYKDELIVKAFHGTQSFIIGVPTREPAQAEFEAERFRMALRRASIETPASPELLKKLEELKTFKQLLHNIQMYANVTMNAEAMQEIIGRICDWSYSHRCGNGELSDEEQQALIDAATERLLAPIPKKEVKKAG